MTADERAKLVHVIRTFGFLDPLTVRPLDDERYQIIDGENRWEVGTLEGMAWFPCWVIDVDRDTAMQLTPILNELHGTADAQKLGALLKDLTSRLPEQQVRDVMPFSQERFDAAIGAITVDWGALEQKREALANSGEERWVERVFRMPALAAEVVDQAIARARAEAESEYDWTGLEYVCAEYLNR
jgi:ParB-like chromosome segregation protein Spo0J